MLKKYMLVGLVVISMFFVTGCGKEKTKTVYCKAEKVTATGAKISDTSTVTYTGKYVNKTENIEIITSDDQEILNQYIEKIEAKYLPYKDVGSFEYKIIPDETSVKVTVRMNYDRIDYDKLVEINGAFSEELENGKLPIKKLLNMYKKDGFDCK